LVYESKQNFEQERAPTLEFVGNKLKALESLLANSEYLAGNTLTYVDFVVFEYIELLLVFNKPTVEPFPRLLELH
jgi:glutathione S-transferase